MRIQDCIGKPISHSKLKVKLRQTDNWSPLWLHRIETIAMRMMNEGQFYHDITKSKEIPLLDRLIWCCTYGRPKR